ncbi:hypothetical protein BDQ12DRAFT_666561 [Crucibulum laeve]|uniref:Sorbose reductase sou1 n=1 Tax=Crucibulum laeve TaxID=68775 RepID=A0A5C3LXJ7_9AGAR|nr:hypothetical protein BDQ12DRAFT_666561 [Crucibulum laeve]
MSTPETPKVGVAAVLGGVQPASTALSQFSLRDRVALVTGAGRGIGLEMAFALAEAGAIVYCLDLPPSADADFLKVQKYITSMPSDRPGQPSKSRMEYVNGDVTDQKAMWKLAQDIAEKEGRLDVCIANAGILAGEECLDYDGEEFKKLIDVNVNGVLFTAQAAGRQMARLGIPGSIIMTASMSGSIANQGQHWVAYNTSKSAVLQMARSMACELGEKKIRVNSISPGYIYTQMTKNFLDHKSELMKKWSAQNPLGRLGRPDELRGVTVWLASDASTFCTGSDIIVDGGHRAW